MAASPVYVSISDPAASRAPGTSDPDAMYGTLGASDAPAAVPDVRKQDIAAHVAVLRESFATGSTKQLETRRALLRQVQRLVTDGAPLLSEAMWRDMHKHPGEAFAMELGLAQGEVQEHLDYLEDWTRPERRGTNLVNLPGLSYIYREPLGVVCIIGTWNYPVQLLLVPLIAALSAGNCVLLRLPGEDTCMHTNNALISLLDKFVDRRYVRYVYGGVDETKAMLREHFDLIFATGGSFLGKIVARAAAEYLTPTVLELGGKSPAVVDDSADLALAAKRLAWGAFVNAGQTCVRPDYILVDERVGDRLVEKLLAEIQNMFGREPKDSDSYARIVNARLFARLDAVVQKDKAFAVCGGETDEKQRYVAPTVLNFKTDAEQFHASAAMADEIFGPVLPIHYYPAGDLGAAIKFIVSNEKPLALYHFSSKSALKERVVRETSSGSMMLNDCLMQLSNADVPFGGVGNSGMGAYHGRHGVEAFSHKKTVIYKNGLMDIPARYPPYSSGKLRLLKLALYPFTRWHWRLLKALPVVVIIAIVAVVVKASV
jgi:aldehyde dehydrogenase (NAD+)